MPPLKHSLNTHRSLSNITVTSGTNDYAYTYFYSCGHTNQRWFLALPTIIASSSSLFFNILHFSGFFQKFFLVFYFPKLLSSFRFLLVAILLNHKAAQVVELFCKFAVWFFELIIPKSLDRLPQHLWADVNLHYVTSSCLLFDVIVTLRYLTLSVLRNLYLKTSKYC